LADFFTNSSGHPVFQVYSEEVVIAVATAIAVLDVFFIMVAVPGKTGERRAV
jgi:hypothetical protein